MVAKITTGTSVYGVLAYNQEKADRNKARVLGWNRVMERPDGTVGMAECMRSFEPYLAANLRTEKPVLHVSLNPHPDDRTDDTQLEALGREYMEKMDYGDQPYVIFRHDDNGRPHIHIVSLRIDAQGRKIKDYKERERSMAACRELERKYGLLPPQKTGLEFARPMARVDYTKGGLKRQIASVVKPAVRDYRFQSFKEFKTLLGLFGVTVEEVHKTVDGRRCDGLVYAALDENGKRTGVGIKSSDIGKSVGYAAVKKKFVRSKAQMEEHPIPERTREAIREAMRQDTRKGFLDELAGKGIVPVLWENGAGVIYGVTYVDHGSKTVFKGSTLGKEFSAAALNRLYGTPLPSGSGSAAPPIEAPRQEAGPVEGLLDILTPEAQPHPEDYPQGIYGKRKKKRKRRGPHIG